MHGDGDLWPDVFGGLCGFLRGHDVCAAHRQTSDVDVEAFHLRYRIRISSMIDPYGVHGNDESEHLLLLRMERLAWRPELVHVVGRHCLHRHIVNDYLLARFRGSYLL